MPVKKHLEDHFLSPAGESSTREPVWPEILQICEIVKKGTEISFSIRGKVFQILHRDFLAIRWYSEESPNVWGKAWFSPSGHFQEADVSIIDPFSAVELQAHPKRMVPYAVDLKGFEVAMESTLSEILDVLQAESLNTSD